MTIEEQIKELSLGLSVDEVVYLIKGDDQKAVNSLEPIKGETLAELILMYLRDGYTAVPF